MDPLLALLIVLVGLTSAFIGRLVFSLVQIAREANREDDDMRGVE